MKADEIQIGDKVKVWYWGRTGIGECDFFIETGVVTHKNDYCFVLDGKVNVVYKNVDDIVMLKCAMEIAC